MRSRNDNLHRNIRTHLAGALALLLATAVGCGGEEPTPVETETDDQPMQLLASVPADDGTAVEFYEGTPGVILVSQTGPDGVPPRLTAEQIRQTSPRKLLEQIKPAEMAIPKAFVEAMVRRDQLRAELSTMEPPEKQAPAATQAPADGISSRTQAVTKSTYTGYLASWFFDYFCETDSRYNVGWVMLNRTSSNTTYRSDVNGVYIAVGAVKDKVRWQVRYRPWWSWGTYGKWDVPQGRYRRVMMSDGYDFDVESKVYKYCPFMDLNCYAKPYPTYHHCGQGVRDGTLW